jgi:reactive intermediate/imine deaminase
MLRCGPSDQAFAALSRSSSPRLDFGLNSLSRSFSHNPIKENILSLPSFHMIDAAPQPVATFSHAAEIDGWVFLTGQMPTWPGEPDRPLPEGVTAQTRRVMDNLILVLDGMCLGIENVVQARIYLTEFERDYADMNLSYKSYFEEGKLPARTCIGVTALAVGALVEIDVIAKRP